jgi:hypothetical protein
MEIPVSGLPWKKVIKRAGIQRWPKLWQNLRASAATDLAGALPAHVAAAICGHTEQIAREHYWQVASSDLDLAITLMPRIAASDCEVNCGHNAGQSEAAAGRVRFSRRGGTNRKNVRKTREKSTLGS